MKTAIALVLAFLLIVSGGLIYQYHVSLEDITGNAISISKFSSILDRIRGPRTGIPAAGGSTAYPIHLSLSDARNPAFSEVDLTKYQRFQTENPDIFEHMTWASSRNNEGNSIIYSNPNMEKLAYYLALLESNQPFPYTAPPAGFNRRVSGKEMKYFTEEEALRMWLPHIAVSLYVEVNRIVNWSIKSYNDEELAALFDARKVFRYKYAGIEGYTMHIHYLSPNGMDGITDWNPFYTLEFLKSKKIIKIPRTLPSPEPSRPVIGAIETVSFTKPEKEAQKKAIYALTQWMRAHLVHESSTSGPEHRILYGYDGLYPLDKILNPPEGAESITKGCIGTTSIYGAMLSLINIPVQKSASIGRHIAPLFPTVGIAMLHGDDPYIPYFYVRRGLQEIPPEKFFITIDEFHAMNNAPLVPYEGYTPLQTEQTKYVQAKQTAQNAYRYKAYTLLRERAVDFLWRIPSGNTESTLEQRWTTEYWMPLFSREEMNSMFSAMDTEILRIGAGNYTEGYMRICRGITNVGYDCNRLPT